MKINNRSKSYVNASPDELIENLIAISVVAKHLAEKLSRERNDDHGQNG